MPAPKLRFKDEQGQEYPKWESMKLGESTYIERGGSPRPINRYITNNPNGINWIKIGDAPVEGNVITSVKEKIIPEGVSKSRKVFKGDLILSNSMSYGRPYLLAVDGCIHDGWLLIRNDKNIFDIRFLMQELSSQYVKTQYDRLSNQGVVSNLNKELVKSVLIKIPFLPEQEKIADFLTAYDHMIDVQSQRVEAMRTRKKGLLQQIFSQEIRFKDDQGQNYPEWVEKQLGEVGNVTKLAGFEFTSYVNYSDQGHIIALRGLNVKNGSLILNDVKYIDNSDFSKLSRSKLYKNDLLYTYVGTVGEVAIINDDDRFYLAPNVARIRFENTVVARYMMYCFESTIFYNNKVRPLIASSSQPALSMGNIRKFKIPLPSLQEQQKIADFLTAVDVLIEVEEKRLETMKTIKKGLLQQMFI